MSSLVAHTTLMYCPLGGTILIIFIVLIVLLVHEISPSQLLHIRQMSASQTLGSLCSRFPIMIPLRSIMIRAHSPNVCFADAWLIVFAFSHHDSASLHHDSRTFAKCLLRRRLAHCVRVHYIIYVSGMYMKSHFPGNSAPTSDKRKKFTVFILYFTHSYSFPFSKCHIS